MFNSTRSSFKSKTPAWQPGTRRFLKHQMYPVLKSFPMLSTWRVFTRFLAHPLPSSARLLRITVVYGIPQIPQSLASSLRASFRTLLPSPPPAARRNSTVSPCALTLHCRTLEPAVRNMFVLVWWNLWRLDTPRLPLSAVGQCSLGWQLFLWTTAHVDKPGRQDKLFTTLLALHNAHINCATATAHSQGRNHRVLRTECIWLWQCVTRCLAEHVALPRFWKEKFKETKNVKTRKVRQRGIRLWSHGYFASTSSPLVHFRPLS